MPCSADGNLRFDVREQDVTRVDLRVAVFTGEELDLSVPEDMDILQVESRCLLVFSTLHHEPANALQEMRTPLIQQLISVAAET